RSRRIGWAIDQGTPAPGIGAEPVPNAPAVSASLRHARLVAEREAVAAVIPSDPSSAFYRSRNTVDRLERKLEDLDKAEGWCEWRGTPLGEAAIAWSGALRESRGSLVQAERAGLRERHRLRQQARRAAEQVGPLRERFEALAGPERARLKVELPEAKRNLADLQGRRNAYMRFQYEHPEALRRLDRLDEQIATAAWELGLERQELDGIRAEPAQQSAQQWAIERGVRGLDRGMDLGIDL
ncbi:MAG: hypothetical protein ACR2KK_23165, partial [Acidimicrobiales bacterium]